MLESVDEITKSLRLQPPWNRTGAVAAALRALASADSDSAADAAYIRVLYAVGNNHRGTYSPIVLDVVPFLSEILEGGAPLPRARALDILIDLVQTFEPDSEIMGGTQDELDGLRAQLRSSVRDLTPLVQRCAEQSDTPEVQALARDLLDYLDDDTR